MSGKRYESGRGSKDNSGSCYLDPLVRIISGIGDIGLFFAKIAFLLPWFLLTAKDWDENIGEWHQRKFGKPFINPNTSVSGPPPLTGSENNQSVRG